MRPSPIQRLVRELRRRHVPQTAAIYLVAAWAAIQFADVVVPNLNGPQWVVTAVIVAALVGFPVMLVVAWVFEWGPEGLHRTDEEAGRPEGAGDAAEPGEAGVPRRAGAPTTSSRAQLWLAVVAVLVVGIGSALAVTFVLRREEPVAGAPVDTLQSGRDTRAAPARGSGETPAVPPVPLVPEIGRSGQAIGDSIRRRLLRTFGTLDSLDLSELSNLGRRIAAESGVGVVIARPAAWQYGGEQAPVPLARGDTLTVDGVAMDSAGVAGVTVDGRTVAEADPPEPALEFTARIIGQGSGGLRTVVIGFRTTDGREIRREFQIIQMPGGTP